MKEVYDALVGLYDIGETIGSGGFAKVKKATHRATGERVAIKILDKASLGADLPRVAREINTLKTLCHPHICKLYHVIETPENFFMVMEYCRGGELFDYIVQRDRLEDNEARRFFRQIASAVEYIHAMNVVHRDLKPENILLDDSNNVKVIDFGLCAIISNRIYLETCCGSPAYASPELVRGEPYIGPQADVWSLGVLLYALLNGFLPFEDPNIGALYRKIQDGRYNEPKWLSEGAKNILRCMLQVNPTYRLSVSMLMNHTWCQQGKFEPLPQISPLPINQVLENDILQKMSFGFGISMSALHEKLSRWDYGTNDTATYLILASRKIRYGVQMFRNMPFRISDRSQAQRIQKSLEAEFSDTDSVDADIRPSGFPVPPCRTYHASMEGGLDDYNLLLIGSPKALERALDQEFLRPSLPSPRKSKLEIDDKFSGLGNLSPARSADSVLHDSSIPKTPVREKWKNITTPVKDTSSPKRNVFGSIERGLDRFRHMLTPKASRDKKKARCIQYNTNKNLNVNVTSTLNNDPDSVMQELVSALSNIGIEAEQRGYHLTGKWGQNGKTVKFELEVVMLEPMGIVGIRRKRHNGDSWTYKNIIEQILHLTGVCHAESVEATPTGTTPCHLQTEV